MAEARDAGAAPEQGRPSESGATRTLPSQASRGVLAVFAHPDDEVLCAGGTLALCRSLGQRVTVVCATRGELGPVADPALVQADELSVVRERELRASCAALGIEDVRLLGLPDSGLQWAADTEDCLRVLVQLIRSVRPHVILTFGPDGLYGHADHVAIGEAVTQARLAAARPELFAEPSTSPRFAAYATPRLFFPVITGDDVAKVVADMQRACRPFGFWSLAPADFLATAADVTARVDVRSVLERKLRALRSHRTQLDADNLLGHLTPEIAASFLGVERFRCAEGRAGDPLSA